MSIKNTAPAEAFQKKMFIAAAATKKAAVLYEVPKVKCVNGLMVSPGESPTDCTTTVMLISEVGS